MKYTVREPEDFGRAVAEFRALRGRDQATLAAEVGINRTYLSNLENGATPAYVTRLIEILHVLGLTITIAEQ